MGVITNSAQMGYTIRGIPLVKIVLSTSCSTIDGCDHEPHHRCTVDIQQDVGNSDYYGIYYSDHYYDHSHAGPTHRPHRALTIIIILLSVLWSSDARRHHRQVHGPRAPQTLTQAHGTYVNKHVYGKISNTHIDTTTVRIQPSAAKAAHGLSIITMNITSLNSKVYRYVASLKHDVIFIQEHRKTMPGQIKVPKGYKMRFSPAQITGSKTGGTLNISGGASQYCSTLSCMSTKLAHTSHMEDITGRRLLSHCMMGSI